VRYVILAAAFTAAMYGDDITIPLDGGTIVIENPQFIRKGGSGINVAGLTFTLTNHTSSAWMSIDLLFNITYVCSGEAHQRSEAVKVGLGWTKDAPIKKEYHDLVIPLMGEVDACKTESIKVTLTSATDLDNLRVEGPAGGRAGLTEQGTAAGIIRQPDQQESATEGDEERTGQAVTGRAQDRRAAEDQAKSAAKAARRRRLAAEQKRKQAEADARFAKMKAEADERAAEARRKESSNGLMGGAILLLIALVVFLVAVKAASHGNSSRAASTTSPSVASVVAAVPPVLTVRSSRPVSAPVVELPPAHPVQGAEWIGVNDCVTVAGFRIPGLVYVGRNLRAIKGYDAEPALIDPSKPVAPSTAGFDPASIPYWPSYSAIMPVARHAYLKWQASGRSAAEAPISFAFLYFYGLERRVLHDYGSKTERGEEYQAILGEVRRLLEVYGENNSFRRYASAFLEMAQAIHHTVNTDDPPPDYPVLGYDLPSRLKIALGLMARDCKPIPPAWACAWVSADPLFPRRTPFLRCNTYFKELFALRYREKWGAGIVVKPNKTTIRLEYQPASASFGGQVTASTALPDITVLKEPIGTLKELGAECMDNLDAYSRYLGRNPGAEAHPAAMAMLPPALLAGSQTGEARLVRESLAARVNSGAILSRDELVKIVKLPTDAGFAKRDAVAVAQYLASMGFGIEPDVRFGGPVPGGETKVYLFPAKPGAASAPTQAYSAATLLIHMAALVSAADGTISPEEEKLLENHIASALDLSEDERDRLNAHLCWVLAERPGLSGVKKRIESLTASQRQAIGRFLVGVANADGHVSPEEVDTLGKLYRLLGLNPEDVYSDVHQAVTEPVTVQPPASAATGFALPPRKQKPTPAGVQLDAAMIEAKLKETAAVSALLASVFVEESMPSPATMLRAVDIGECIAGLDMATSAFLRYLSARPAWAREELEIAAAERSLLLDGSIEAINEAAFDACDEPALEGDNPIEINAAVLSALLERTRIQ
jgi:tellurite resistance protein